MWTLVAALLVVAPLMVSAGGSSNSTGGVSCPPGPNCLDNKALCVGGECECQPPYLEQDLDGQLDCYKKSDRWGRSVNDPVIKVFDQDPQYTYKYLLPCRALFSHSTTVLKARGEGIVGNCECKTYTWNEKSAGKIFVGGLGLTCRVNRTSDAAFYTEFTTRIRGTASNGVYSFTEYGSNTFMDESPVENVEVSINEPGITYKSEIDDVNNRIVLDFWSCGHRVTFTPYDITKNAKSQPYLAGSSVAINCAFKPVFLSPKKVMSTGPPDFDGPTFASAIIPGLDARTSFEFRALTSGVAQSQPNGNQKCLQAGANIALCDETERTTVNERCNFILEKAHFINCVDNTNNGDVLMELLIACIGAICDPAQSCADFSTLLSTKASGCPDKAIVGFTPYENWTDGTWTC